MPDPNALYDDMEKLNALFEELCWDCDDELMFSHDGSKVIITNKTQELEQWTKTQNASMVGQQWSEWSLQWVVMQSQVKSFQEYGECYSYQQQCFWDLFFGVSPKKLMTITMDLVAE